MARDQESTPLHGAETHPREHVNQYLVAAGSAEATNLLRPDAVNNTSPGAAWAVEDVECSYDLFDLQDSGLVAA